MTVFNQGVQDKRFGKQPRKKGKYARKRNYKARFALYGSALVLIGSFGAGLFMTSQPASVEYAHAETKVIDKTPEKIEALKAKVVDQLLACEAAGHTEDEAIIMYDNNKAGTLKGKNVWSIGQLQWKVSTIQTFVKQRDGKAITQKEAVLLALDSDRARELAQWVIFETKGGINHWYNCSVKHNLAAKVSVIKELEQ